MPPTVLTRGSVTVQESAGSGRSPGGVSGGALPGGSGESEFMKPTTKPTQVTDPSRETSKTLARPVLWLQGVTKHYGVNHGGLQRVDLKVPQGGFLLVTGPSGAGKTTLLKLLYGAERPTQGRVLVLGQDVAQLRGDRLSRFRRQLGVVFQDYKLIPNRTVTENIAFVLWAQGHSQGEINRRLPPTLKLVGLAHKGDHFPDQLSGGEQQRVSLARAIVSTPPLLLTDEPTGNLDTDNSLQVLQILNELNRMGVTVVVTTHDELLVQRSPHPVVHVHQGQLHWMRR